MIWRVEFLQVHHKVCLKILAKPVWWFHSLYNTLQTKETSIWGKLLIVALYQSVKLNHLLFY